HSGLSAGGIARAAGVDLHGGEPRPPLVRRSAAGARRATASSSSAGMAGPDLVPAVEYSSGLLPRSRAMNKEAPVGERKRRPFAATWGRVCRCRTPGCRTVAASEVLSAPRIDTCNGAL